MSLSIVLGSMFDSHFGPISFVDVITSSSAFHQALNKISQMASTSKGPAKPLGKNTKTLSNLYKIIESMVCDPFGTLIFS